MTFKNPFQSPQHSSRPRRRAEPGMGMIWSPAWILVAATLACAMAAGIAYYRLDQPGGDGVEFAIFWSAPVCALLAVTGLSIGSNAATLGTQAVRGARTIVLSCLIFVAGYIAFAATCCCTNMFVGGFTLYPELEGSNWRSGLQSRSVRGGLVTAISTVLSAVLLFALHRLRCRRQS